MKRLALLFTFALACPLGVVADAPTNDSSGELSLPWTAFERLFQLNQDRVTLSWEEYQRLVKQIGVVEVTNPGVQNGQVVLTRAEFNRLLERMRPPAGEAPPVYLTEALYSGTVGKKSTSVTARFRLQVIAKGPEMATVRLPLFPNGVALQSISLDGRPALVENTGDGIAVLLSRPGDHDVVAVFAAPSSLDRAPHELNFAVPPTAVTRADFFIPGQKVDADIPGAGQVESTPAAGGTRVRAVLPATGQITLRWTSAEPETARGPARVYAVGRTLLSVQEDSLKLTHRLELDVLQNTIATVNLSVPAGWNVLDVTGDGVGEWTVRGDAAKVLVVPFSGAKQGKFTLTITAEQGLKDKSAVADYAGFTVVGAVRESAQIGIEAQTSAEVKVLEFKGLRRIDGGEVPPELLSLSPKPFLYTFAAARPPLSLSLDIQRHADVPVVSTVIDEANAVSLVLKEGQRVTHLTFNIRNSWKQFLELALPADAQVWSATVAGRRVSPSKNGEGRVLIPLNRSQVNGNELTPFEVEVLYVETSKKLPLLGRATLALPAPDVVVGQLIWSVYLPANQDYLFFTGDVEKELAAGGLRPIGTAILGRKQVISNLTEGVAPGASYSQNDSMNSAQWVQRGRFDAAQSIDDNAYARQVAKELNFFSNVNRAALTGGAAGGLRPLRIAIPKSGVVYRFNKLLVQNTAALHLRAVHVHSMLLNLIRLAVFAGVLVVLWRVRGTLKTSGDRIRAWIRRHLQDRPWTLPVGGAVLWLFGLWWPSRLLAVVGFLGLLASGVRWGWETLKARRAS